MLYNLPGKMHRLSSGSNGCGRYSGSHTGTWWTRLQVSWNCRFAPLLFLHFFTYESRFFLLLFHFTQVSKGFNDHAVWLHLGACAKHWCLHPCQDQCQPHKEEQGQAPWPSSYPGLWRQFLFIQSFHWLSVCHIVRCENKMWKKVVVPALQYIILKFFNKWYTIGQFKSPNQGHCKGFRNIFSNIWACQRMANDSGRPILPSALLPPHQLPFHSILQRVYHHLALTQQCAEPEWGFPWLTLPDSQSTTHGLSNDQRHRS